MPHKHYCSQPDICKNNNLQGKLRPFSVEINEVEHEKAADSYRLKYDVIDKEKFDDDFICIYEFRIYPLEEHANTAVCLASSERRN